LPELTELRRRISIIKANQIIWTGARRIVTPCAVCMLSLNDICDFYKLMPQGRRMAFMMFEAVFEAVSKALKLAGEMDRLRLPAVFRGKDKVFVQQHGLYRIVDALMHSPDILALSSWLKQDEIVQRFLGSHPGAQLPLNHYDLRIAVEKNARKEARLCGNC
jgi:hypothetical protein